MIQQPRVGRIENGGSGGADEAVKDDRNARRPCGQNRAADRRLFAPAKGGQYRGTIADDALVPFQPPPDRVDLAGDSGRVRTCSGPGPFGHLAAERGRRQSRRDSRIADPHLTQNEDIGAVIHRRGTLPERVEAVGFGHCGAFGEVPGRPVKIQRDDRQLGSVDCAKLVDRRAAVFEIRDHLGGDFLRIGVHALRADAVIAGEDQGLRLPDLGPGSAAPCRHELGQFLQPSQRSRRLGQRVLPCPRRLGGGRVGLGQTIGQLGNVGKGGEARQAHVISLSGEGRQRQARLRPPLPPPID